jgi:hypothetical protein
MKVKEERMDNLIEIAPSILPADFAILAVEIKKVEQGGCERLQNRVVQKIPSRTTQWP